MNLIKGGDLINVNFYFEKNHKVLKYIQVHGGSKRSFRRGDIKENDGAVGVL